MTTSIFIDGKWLPGVGERKVTNPATGEILAVVEHGDGSYAKQAVDAAYRAFPKWAALTAEQRADYLYKLYEKMMERQGELARLMTEEQGKPIREAKGEIAYSASFVKWYAEEAKRVYGETIPASSPSKRLMVMRQPVGVTAVITPWNFPSAMITRKLAPALAAGCTVVVKPPNETPLSAMELFKIMEEVGFPPGVANMLIGPSREIGDAWLDDERVRKITFTGSTEVGRELMEKAAKTIKNVSFELGGHAPFIIFDDANIDQAITGLINSKFRNAGQTCICANRAYVQRSVYDQVVEKMVERVGRMTVGHGKDNPDIGPLISEAAYKKVKEHIDDAVAKGGKILVGGKRLEGSAYENGYFVQPTIIGDATRDMLIHYEETFGPVLPLIPFDGEAEAIEMANDTIFGLAAYFYTENLSRAYRVAEQLEYGIVGMNDALPSTAQAPFGGMKQSGIGREGGHYGIDAFLETKFVSIGLWDR